MVRVVIIRPGTTDYDEQRRIAGTLDIPLNQYGMDQVARTANDLANEGIEIVYTSPCRAADESARVLAQSLRVKAKTASDLRNVDHGLWQGKLIEEVKATQRKVYRQWQDQPETVCPPEGEMLDHARRRIQTALDKLLKKHKKGTIALVVPEPLASLVCCYLAQGNLGDLWQAEAKCASWQVIDVVPDQLVPSALHR
jgi:broad specificity phosphatase PhoE